jgi:hypothetical protein
LCGSILLMGCDDDSSFETGSNNYLPLQVGNVWIFRSMQDDNDYRHYKRVTAKVTLDDVVYAQVVSGSYANGAIYDTAYYRVEDNGHVYFRRKNSVSEENRFRLYGRDGDTWTYTIENDDTVAITLSAISLNLNNKNLRDCKAYYYDVSKWADEEYTTTLAKGIGFVQEYSNAWGWGQVLESATINGRKFDF